MIALLARKLALTLLLALLVVMLLEQFNPEPPEMLMDTGLFHHAQRGIPDNARPILQRCYPVEPASNDALAAIGLEQEPVT